MINTPPRGQSFVLLKNGDAPTAAAPGAASAEKSGAGAKVLPMARGKKTALVGPHVNSARDLMSDYKGDEQCVGKVGGGRGVAWRGVGMGMGAGVGVGGGVGWVGLAALLVAGTHWW
jgi:hypothetical protein